MICFHLKTQAVPKTIRNPEYNTILVKNNGLLLLNNRLYGDGETLYGIVIYANKPGAIKIIVNIYLYD